MGMTLAPSATPNGGAVVAGMVGARYVASTTRRRTSTRTVSPEASDVTRCDDPSVVYSLPPMKVTRPDASRRR